MSLLIHPGFHKTATTWLQQSVFSDRTIFRSLLTHQEIDALLVRPHDFDFEPSHVSEAIRELRGDTEAAVVDVISSEILSGNILFGSRDSLSIAGRLAATCPQAKILLTVRSQPSIAKSIYMQHVKRGGRLSVAEFFSPGLEPGYFGFDPGSLDFGRMAQAYADRFGHDHVLVLPQELLRADREQFLALLYNFAGVQTDGLSNQPERAAAHGVSPPASGLGLIRLSNIIRHTPITPGSFGPFKAVGNALSAAGYRWTLGKASADARLGHDIAQQIDFDFGPSNTALQKYCPVDLGELGYALD